MLNVDISYLSTLNPGLLSTNKLTLNTVTLPAAKAATTNATILCGLGINIVQTTSNTLNNPAVFPIAFSTLNAVTPRNINTSNTINSLSTTSNYFVTLNTTANDMYNNFYLEVINGQTLISNINAKSNSAILNSKTFFNNSITQLNQGTSNYTSSFKNFKTSFSTTNALSKAIAYA